MDGSSFVGVACLNTASSALLIGEADFAGWIDCADFEAGPRMKLVELEEEYARSQLDGFLATSGLRGFSVASVEFAAFVCSIEIDPKETAAIF